MKSELQAQSISFKVLAEELETVGKSITEKEESTAATTTVATIWLLSVALSKTARRLEKMAMKL